MTSKELAKFIETSVMRLIMTDDDTACKKILDEDFAVYVGWGAGFDENDETAIHSKKQPTYCICVKIAENIPNFTWEDAYMPWYKDGEVYDTDCSLYAIKTDGFYSVAKWLLSEYRNIRKLYKNDILRLY